MGFNILKDIGQSMPHGMLTSLQSAASTYQIALEPRAKQKVLTLRNAPAQRALPSIDACCVNAHGLP